MDQRDKTGHHRSKSQIAKSILHKVSSRHDVNKEEQNPPSESPSRSSLGGGASESNISLASRSSRQRHPLSTNMTPPTTEDTLTQNAPTSPVGTSLEQSVLLFKYFETLRGGDKAHVAKAVKEQATSAAPKLEGTTLLHLSIQCSDIPTIEYVLASTLASVGGLGTVNSRDKDGNTPLHLAARLGRAPVVRMILDQEGVNDTIINMEGQTPLDLAYSPEIFQQLQLARSLYLDANVRKIHELVARKDYKELERLFNDSKIKIVLDLNGTELATDKTTVETGGTLLHEASRNKDIKLIQLLLMSGADPFRRDRKGKLPQDTTKDEKTRHILKKSPAAEAAQRSVQEKGILGSAPAQAAGASSASENPLGGKESREMKGYLKKWTNYTGGWKLRWFVLEEGVLSYYKHQDDAGAACRGAINMKISKLSMDPQDKLRFEIQGKSSVKYHLKANHQVEAKRWYWALNNAIQWAKDEDREEQRRIDRESESLRYARSGVGREGDSISLSSRARTGPGRNSLTVPQQSVGNLSSYTDADEGDASLLDPGASPGGPATRMTTRTDVDTYDEDVDAGDDASSHDAQPVQKDALNITAQSLRLQLDLLAQVSASLAHERKTNPELSFADPTASQAISAYESAVGNLKGLIGDFLRIANDRDSYWQYRLDREINIRRMWEESMAKVAKEQELLEAKMEELEDKRKQTKRALRDALERTAGESNPMTPVKEGEESFARTSKPISPDDIPHIISPGRKPTFAELAEHSDAESEDEEFFDAVGAGEVEVVGMTSAFEKEIEVPQAVEDSRDRKLAEIQKAFVGYEGPLRTKLKMDDDNRPKISLWVSRIVVSEMRVLTST